MKVRVGWVVVFLNDWDCKPKQADRLKKYKKKKGPGCKL
jgi:hypothetical protein